VYAQPGIRAVACGNMDGTIYGERQHEAIVVVRMLTNEIDATGRSGHYDWPGAEHTLILRGVNSGPVRRERHAMIHRSVPSVLPAYLVRGGILVEWRAGTSVALIVQTKGAIGVSTIAA
jgi:hypothetical protein